MARDPGSVWAPLPEAGAPDGFVKTQFIVHSTGDNGTAAATARYFGGTTPNESTFIVGRGRDDPTLQIMDSTDRADANLSASIRAVSVEVVGDGVGGYNAWQRSELIRLGIWAKATHPQILPRIIPAHDQAGYGWHVMFGAPGPWAKGAKVCPGKKRIAELKADIFPAIFTGKNKNPGGFLMALTDAEQQEVLDRLRGDTSRGYDMLQSIESLAKDVQYRVRGLHPAMDSLQVIQWQIAGLATPAGVDEAALAAALAAAIPNSLAEQVAQKLADRLAD